MIKMAIPKKEQPLKVLYKKTADLKPCVKNSRTHSHEQIEQIASSINEFGFTNPLLIDDEGIIAGHGRLLAAIKLDMVKVPTIKLVGLSEAQRKAYVIADNKLALNAGWDDDLLRSELMDLNDMDFDLDLIGFDADELSTLLDIETDMPELRDGDREPFQQKTFTLHDEQVSIVDEALKKAISGQEFDIELNENSNGNALSYICEKWLESLNG